METLKQPWNNLKDFFEPLSEIVWRDQFVHFVVGLLLTSLFVGFMHPVFAVILSMLIAVVRENIQHPLQCGQGCRTDLMFWALGSLMVPVVLIVGA